MATKAAPKVAKTYSEKDVKHFANLDAIRQRPNMYIGPTDSTGVWTCIREAADNTVDEAIAGRNSICYLHLSPKGYWIADSGQGIPTGLMQIADSVTHKVHKVSALKAIVSLTHAGGKFDDKAYAASRGVHGVGIKATNALAESFKLWTFYSGKWWHTAYSKGKEVTPVSVVKSGPKLPNGKTPKKGTVVCFVPDKTIFDSSQFAYSLAFDWAKVSAYLVPGLKVIVEAPRGKDLGVNRKEYYFENGPRDYVSDRLKELKAEALGETFYVSTPIADVAFVAAGVEEDGMSFYTNGLLQVEGGVHRDSFYSAIFNALKPYGTKRGKLSFGATDLREGFLGMLNVKMSTPKFDSQTKEKLVDERAKAPLKDALQIELEKFFKANKKLAIALCDRAAKLSELKAKFTASKKVIRELSKLRSKGMPAKFAGANKCKPGLRETFIVEGESAGGTAKQARDKNYQEVLPLKGKIINAMRAKKGTQVLESEEVINILGALGFDPKAANPYEKLRTGKVIWLADPDPDGHHINSLGLTLLYKYLPKLFELGMVYVADAPEYIAEIGNKVYSGKSVEEVYKKAGKKCTVSHLKGWGEVEPEVLGPLAFDPATRTLFKVVPITTKQGKTDFQKLMGEDPVYRKELLGV